MSTKYVFNEMPFYSSIVLKPPFNLYNLLKLIFKCLNKTCLKNELSYAYATIISELPHL